MTAGNSQFPRDQAANEVRAMITDGFLVPGDLVPSVRELAAQTGLERTSCYEGLRLLARKGVLTRGGTPAGRLRVAGDGDARVAAERAAWGQELLTPAGWEAFSMLGQVYTLFRDDIVEDGPTRDADLAEICTLVHYLQDKLARHALAQARPSKVRPLGGVIPQETDR